MEGLTNAGYEVSAVSTAKTGELSGDERARIEAAMTAADVILLALGEDSEDSGEASACRRSICPICRENWRRLPVTVENLWQRCWRAAALRSSRSLPRRQTRF